MSDRGRNDRFWNRAIVVDPVSKPEIVEEETVVLETETKIETEVSEEEAE